MQVMRLPDSKPSDYDVVVVGCGAAGLSAAVSCAESNPEITVALLERSSRVERGGSTRWTGAYLRLADPYTPAPGFAEDMARFSGGKVDGRYVERLVEALPETMEWVQSTGIRLRKMPTIFPTRAKPRLLPEGGGQDIVEKLAAAAEKLGVRIMYDTAATGLLTSGGAVTGLQVEHDGDPRELPAKAVILASGGFEGSQQMLIKYLGPAASALRNISPGGEQNKGEGIAMALAAGARAAGEFANFHAEPIDPRSANPEAVVMVYPYGVLVNRAGDRFLDEGEDTPDETYEKVARAIWAQDSHEAFLIGDQQLMSVPGRSHAILTDKRPYSAGTIPELAHAIGLPADALTRTIDHFNAAVTPGETHYDRLDGRGTAGLLPPKSNWAQPIQEPPYLAYPMACAIVFTFGGIATNENAEVLHDSTGEPIPGLYAAGECTGVYFGKYPGATSVLRSMVFGRIAGANAARVAADDLTR